MQTEKAYHDKIIKNVSTRRSLNLDLWATHKFSLFFKVFVLDWGGFNSSISQRTTLAGCRKT